ncbi:YgiW/YdeI family stress tolerance OB fold protein [Vibrio salilacus]|uniref:YgiW/YdeI family stress tolerance OB fold protein n=1 Tax=Vibrio salilacus TaxID=1323749 RepID=UPI000C2A15A2|nr:NirD/YgiW/YdeI family stress tolerance protein [Vibrio salilacus]
MNKVLLATAVSIILAPGLAMAKNDHASHGVQYTGPVEVSSVASLLEDTSMFTEKYVVVEGNLLRQIKGDTYIFSDGKGEIQVELDDGIVLDQPLDQTSKVRLFGEYEGGSTPEIEIDRLQLL